MSLLGKGAVTIWNDIRWAGRDVFYRWHDEEHMPERVGIEGFLRGRRYIRIEAEVEWFTLYETKTTAVLDSETYLERLNNPTEWTKRTVTYFENVTRGLTEVRHSTGKVDGGNLLSAAYTLSDEGSAGADAFIELVRDRLATSTGIAATHVCIADRQASSIETAERRARGNPTVIPDVVVMLESGRASWLTAARDILDTAATKIKGAEVLRPPGTYRLEYELRK